MRRLFIIRKDLNLSRGKMSAMVGHCCEAYWTNFLKNGLIYDQEYEYLPTETKEDPNYWMRYKHPAVYAAAKEAHDKGLKTFKYIAEFPVKKYALTQTIDKDIWDNYVNGIFTKTICEAKNLNDLLKIKNLIKQYNDEQMAKASIDKNIERINELKENIDYGFINDCCLTELKPENEDGTTTIGIWFRPLSDDVAHIFSKKYKLFDAFTIKRNCDIYKTYEDARKAYIQSHPVTDTNKDMMEWLFEKYEK